MYKLKNPWLRVGIVLLQVVAAIAAARAFLDGSGLPFAWYSEFEAHVAKGLLGWSALAALFLLTGLILGRAIPPMMHDTRFGRRGPGVGALTRTLGAALAITVVLVGYRERDRKLHPSFDEQRAAVVAFPVPPGTPPADIDTELRNSLHLNADFRVPGTENEVCPTVVKRLASWADPGTVSLPEYSDHQYDRVVRRGPDTVYVECFSDPSDTSTHLSLAFDRPY